MSGITFSINSVTNDLVASIDPLLFEDLCSEASFAALISKTDYKDCELDKVAIKALAILLEQAKSTGVSDKVVGPIGKVVEENTEDTITISLAPDHMSASMSVVSNASGKQPSYQEVKDMLAYKGVTRGISKKRVQNLLNHAIESEPGKEFNEIIAIGLPARDGKASKIRPLVPNALDRILRPQEKGGDKVDMRNLGDVLCVSPDQAVAKRIPPTNGRLGYTVSNKPLQAKKGAWVDIKLGQNTKISDADENLILSALAGQPKFENDLMSIDDTYVSKGVNVGTGNIIYEGAVIVNGDVTENMQIIAKGDVTINGFVESAFIQAGGDIIITQGATGKMNEEDCQLIAKGNIFIQHGQGLHVQVDKNFNVKRQLAYSNVTCKGQLFIGDPENPSGNLFASKINAYNSIRAGSVGAISGSVLEVDFSEGYNHLIHNLESVHDLLKALTSVNVDHEIKLSKINAKKYPPHLRKKLKKLDACIGKERHLINWLRKMQGDLELAKKDYESNARIIANKELFPGVLVKLNKRIYRAQKETMKSRILLVDGAWEYQPII
ncbi:DUF342 domain-containing protein [Glaciecola sp. SC05]|uniref:DUF342 domain-containing protein n=1 Tax=Glaciecola sp. SC05 TaxID=1987355 RepID=UPI0035294206